MTTSQTEQFLRLRKWPLEIQEEGRYDWDSLLDISCELLTQCTIGELKGFWKYINENGWRPYDSCETWICTQVSNRLYSIKELYELFKQFEKIKTIIE